METYARAATEAAGTGPAGPRAGTGSRIGAFLIDTVIVVVLFSLLTASLPDVVAVTLGVVFWVGYFAGLESRPAGQTLGKRLLGIRVIVLADGGPLDMQRAVVRAVVRYISWVGLGIGLLAGFFDREKQAWHDVAAQTVVVPTSAYPVPTRS